MKEEAHAAPVSTATTAEVQSSAQKDSMQPDAQSESEWHLIFRHLVGTFYVLQFCLLFGVFMEFESITRVCLPLVQFDTILAQMPSS